MKMKRENLIRNVLVAAFAIGLVFQQSISVVAAFGDVDATFGNNGQTVFYPGSANVIAKGLVREKDGKFIAVGYVIDNNNGSGNPWYYLTIRRYTADGILDTTFGNNGQAIPYNVYGRSTAVALQANGKILVGGTAGTGSSVNAQNYVWRFNTDGWYDSSFGSNGRTLVGNSSVGVRKVAAIKTSSISNIESILVGYGAFGGGVLKKLNSNGTINTLFGQVGALTGVGDIFVRQNATSLQNASITTANFESNMLVLRGYTGDGQPDPGFGNGGMTMSFYGTFNMSLVKGLIKTSQGKLVMYGARCIAGCINYDSFIGVHSASGVLENSNVLGNLGIINVLASNPDGTVIFPYGYSGNLLKKFTSNLSPLEESPGENCNDLFIQSNKIVCATSNKLVRYLQ